MISWRTTRPVILLPTHKLARKNCNRTTRSSLGFLRPGRSGIEKKEKEVERRKREGSEKEKRKWLIFEISGSSSNCAWWRQNDLLVGAKCSRVRRVDCFVTTINSKPPILVDATVVIIRRRSAALHADRTTKAHVDESAARTVDEPRY